MSPFSSEVIKLAIHAGGKPYFRFLPESTFDLDIPEKFKIRSSSQL